MVSWTRWKLSFQSMRLAFMTSTFMVFGDPFMNWPLCHSETFLRLALVASETQYELFTYDLICQRSNMNCLHMIWFVRDPTQVNYMFWFHWKPLLGYIHPILVFDRYPSGLTYNICILGFDLETHIAIFKHKYTLNHSKDIWLDYSLHMHTYLAS